MDVSLAHSKPMWTIDKPTRVGGFRWSFIPEPWWGFFGGNDLLVTIWALILLALWLPEFFLVRPTVGLVRLAMHHSRSPGWYLRVTYSKVIFNGVGDYTVDVETRRKGQAKRIARTLRRELRRARTVDFDAPAVQMVIAENRAVVTVVSNSVPKGIV